MPVTASNEYKAAVIIHEVTHAIIRSNLTSEENKLLGESGKHYLMLQNYIEEMKAFLQETFTLNDQEALSMIFEGISDLNNEVNKPGEPVPEEWYTNLKKLIVENGFSIVDGDQNYYLNQSELFKSGLKGSKNCK